MKDYEYIVLIGRFQISHNAHYSLYEQALEKAEKLVIVLGSHRAAPNIKNPLTSAERQEMISRSLPKEDRDRVSFVTVRDYHYNDELWMAELQQKVREATESSQSVGLLGHYSDSSSYYLRYFKNMEFIPAKQHNPIHATEVRASFFQGTNDWKTMVPSPVVEYLEGFKHTERYRELCAEYAFIQDYKARHKYADPKLQYAPIGNTVDIVLIQSGHVLLVKRKGMPGRGQWALPGGYVKDETVLTSGIRELKEETRIKVDQLILRNSVVGEPMLCDYPQRDLRGRVISNAFLIRLEDKSDLPEVKGGDDAAKAAWVPLGDVPLIEDQMFGDHSHIISFFLHRGLKIKR
jgi:bifunctional NMN adenylyltransferase/nudix hydrolase